MAKRCFSKKAGKLFWVKGLLAVSIAYSVSLAPVFADSIVPDGKTITNLSTSGNTTTVTTATNDGRGNAFNSFSKFNVDAGKVVNLVVPDTATNLINLVGSEATNINGTLNSLKNNQIGGNVFLINPYGIAISSSGVVNVGSLTAITPTTTFANSIIDASGNISSTAVDSILSINTTLSTTKDITNNGKINALDNITLSAINVNNDGSLYTGAQFNQTGPNIGDVVNVNTLDQNPNLSITNGKIDIVTYDHFRNNGIVNSKEVNMYVGEIDMNSSAKIIASDAIALSTKYNSGLIVSRLDRDDDVSAVDHFPVISPREINQLISPKLILGKEFNPANPRVMDIIISSSFTRNGDLIIQTKKSNPIGYSSFIMSFNESIDVIGDLTINNGIDFSITPDSKITANNIYINSVNYKGLDNIASLNAPNGKVVLGAYSPQDIGIGSTEFIKPVLLSKINAKEVVIGNDSKTNNNTANIVVKESLTTTPGLTLAATQSAQVADGVNVSTSGDFTINANTTQIGVGSKVTGANVKFVSDKVIIDTTSANTQISAPTGTVLISRQTAGNVKVGDVDLTDATNLYVTSSQIAKISSQNLTLGNNPTHYNNTETVEINTNIAKSGNLTLVSKGNVLINSNIDLTNNGSLNVEAGNNARLKAEKKISADGSVKLASGKLTITDPLSTIVSKGDIILSSGGSTVLTVGSSLQSENDIAVTGKNVYSDIFTCLLAKNNLKLQASNNLYLSPLTFLKATNNDILLKAGNNIYIQPLVFASAGDDIIIEAGNKAIVSKWSFLDAGDDLIINGVVKN